MTITHPFATTAFQAYPAFQTSLSPYVYPNDLMNLSIKINGVEFKDYLDMQEDQPKIVSVVKQYPTFSCKLFNVPSSLTISNWLQIIVYDNANKVFAGQITYNKGTESDDCANIDWIISATGYAKLLETKLVSARKYDNQTDAYILNDIITEKLPEIDATTYVTALKTFDEIPFGRKSIKEILDYICGITGGRWYVDYDLRLHYFGSEMVSTIFGFSSVPDFVNTYPFYEFSKIDNGNRQYNVVEIIGGNYLSPNETIYLAGTGGSNRINLPFKYHAPVGQSSIQVWRNDGTELTPVWTPMVVKSAYLATADWPTDCLFYYEEKVLEQISAWPAFNNAVKLTGRYEAKLRVRVSDDLAIAAVGREIEYPYYDDSIIDKDIARTLARELLAANSGGIQSYSFKCEKRGLQAGMIVPVYNGTFSVNGSLEIQKVSTDIDIGGQIVSEVEVGRYNPNLVDAIIALKKAAKKTTAYNEEGATDWTLNYNESCTPTESHTLTAS